MAAKLGKSLGFCVTVCLLLLLSIPVIAAYRAHGSDTDSNNFLAAYSSATGTKLDNCYLCHTGGTVSGKSKDSCDYCHLTFGFTAPHGDITNTLNQFGKDYLQAGRSQAAFATIGSTDSDSDGFSNDTEIKAGRLPGDAQDNPNVAEAKSKIYSRAQLRSLPRVDQFMALDTSKAGDYYSTYSGVDIWTLLQNAGVRSDATSITIFAVDGFSKEFQISDLKVTYPQGKFYTKYPWIRYPGNSSYQHGDQLPGNLSYLLAYENDGLPLVDGKINTTTGRLDGEGPYRFVTPLTSPVTPDRSSWSIDREDAPWPYNPNRPTVRNADYCIKSVVAIRINAGTEAFQYDWNGRAYEFVENGQLVVFGAINPKSSNNDDSTGSNAGGGATPAASGTSKSVDSNGGTITGEGASITIPAAAFGVPITVQVNKVNIAEVSVPTVMKLLSEVLDITKSQSGDFSKPVTISMNFDKSKVDTSKYDVAIFWFDTANNKWTKLDNIKVDLTSGKVSGDVMHFTRFAVMAVEKTAAPAGSTPSLALKDIVGHWAEKQINELIAAGVIKGYQDGSFKPDNKISRAEFAIILVKAFKLAPGNGKVFGDCTSHWAKDSIATAAANGIISGYSDSKFGPDDMITREQMAVMIVRAKKLTLEKGDKQFADSGKFSPYALQAIATAAKAGLISGYPDNTFKPQGETTRAEAAALVAKALK
ncbi:MAG: GEGP motif-containing diheme protein [Syntrophomonas sp.]